MFGVKEPDWWGIVDLNTGKAVLFCVRMPDTAVIWMGETKANEHWKVHYAVDEVLYVDDMSSYLLSNYDVLHVMAGLNLTRAPCL